MWHLDLRRPTQSGKAATSHCGRRSNLTRPSASRRRASPSHVSEVMGRVEHMFASETTAQVRPPVPAGLRQKIAPVVPASARTIPVSEALAPLLPGGALRRGTTTVVAGLPGAGATSLGVSLLAEASSRGHWCAAVGFADPGVVAMAELGLDLRRAVFVPHPRAGWAEAAGELFDGVELVVLQPPTRVPHAAARRLMARAQDRRVALIVVTDAADRWPIAPELLLSVTSSVWQGIGLGDGRLSSRLVEVKVTGRRGATRPTTFDVWLPSPSGAVRVAQRRR